MPSPVRPTRLIPASREQRARWAVELQDLALLMGDVAPAAAHLIPVRSPVRAPAPGLARNVLPALPVVWADAPSAGVALDPMRVGDPSRTATLVFCSARHPGGGWERGATAQEEDVSLCSSWALAARQASPGFYDLEHRWEGPHAGLWATGHWFARAPGAWLDDPVPAAFVGVSAPNLTWAREQGVTLNAATLARAHALLVERLVWAMSATAQHGCTALVGGMIGTGVFGWSVADVRQAWGDAVQALASRPGAPGTLERLVMAVPGGER